MSETITVTEQATQTQFLTLKYPVNDSLSDDASPSLDVVPDPNSNIEPQTLTLVNEFLRKQALLKAAKEAKVTKPSEEENDDEIKSLKNDLKSVVEGLNDDFTALKKLLNAANDLKITELKDIVCDIFAEKIKDMTPEEVGKIFDIENDFTYEEEQELRKQDSWAYEL